MAVYYKFKSAKDYDSIPIDGHFISVANLKEKIFESKHLGRGTDFDLMVANAQTNEEYIDEAALIPKNTSVLVRRIPGRPRMPIVTEREDTKPIDNKEEDVQSSKSGLPLADASIMRYPEETEWDEFGNDLYAIPEMLQAQSSNMVQEATVSNKADEDSKIKALVDNSALDWLRQPQDAFGAGRGFGRGMGGRMMGSRGFGRGGGMFERKTPPAGYICHRCKIPGHFIQHCPTNGDPNYDIKKVKPPTGIPKSMLMATPDGSYALPSGAVAVLKPNEAAFEKEIEGLPSTRSVTDIPPELRCPLCKEVMKDAVLTSKCCFKSFCDKCIRDHIISKSACICGATNVLADDLLPNKTLRDTINRLLESNNSSAENVGSMLQIQDMESARPARLKIPSPSLSAAPTLSAASKGELMPPPPSKDNVETKDIAIESQDVSKSPVEPQQSAPTGPHQSVSAGPQQNAPTGTQQLLEKGRTAKAADISEATHESMTVKETTSQGSAAVVEEEVQQKPSASEPGKKKKKKKVRMPLNGAELQWRTPQDFAADGGYGMMPYGPSACNPYWGGMVGMDGFMNPYAGAMPYMGYVPGPFDVPLGGMGGMLPQDPFGGYMMPPVVPPQRDLSELAMGAKPGPPVMSREEFEARKADLRRKREIEQRGAERSFSKERDYARELSGNGDVPSMKSKHKPTQSQADPSDQRRRHYRSERSLTPERPPSHHHREERAPPSPTRSQHHRHRSDKATSLDRPPRDSYDPPRPSKRRPEYDENPADAPPRKRRTPTTEELENEEPTIVKASSASSSLVQDSGKQKGSVFSRISFPEGESAGGAKKQKRKAAASEDDAAAAGHVKESKKDHRHSSHNHHHHSSSHDVIRSTTREDVTMKVGGGGAMQASRRGGSVSMDNDSSDDERHFKRRPSRYEPPPPPAVEWEEDGRHSRRERERERERGHRHR